LLLTPSHSSPHEIAGDKSTIHLVQHPYWVLPIAIRTQAEATRSPMSQLARSRSRHYQATCLGKDCLPTYSLPQFNRKESRARDQSTIHPVQHPCCILPIAIRTQAEAPRSSMSLLARPQSRHHLPTCSGKDSLATYSIQRFDRKESRAIDKSTIHQIQHPRCALAIATCTQAEAPRRSSSQFDIPQPAELTLRSTPRRFPTSPQKSTTRCIQLYGKRKA
jgi:predicted secreted protein